MNGWLRGFDLAAGIFLFLAGLVLGYELSGSAWRMDCEAIGYRTDSGKLYECKVIKSQSNEAKEGKK